MNTQVHVALRLAIDCIVTAAEIAHPLGAPSGIVYSALSTQGMSLSTYQAILQGMQEMGTITVRDNLIFLTGKD